MKARPRFPSWHHRAPVVSLREVEGADLEALYEHQADPVAARMAATPSHPRDEFLDYWTWLRGDRATITRAIIADGRLVGSIASFLGEDGEREVGYWLARDAWGRGIATEALRQFLRLVALRPLHARVAQTNVGSRRVLEKCGFTVVGEAMGPSDVPGEEVPDYVMRLEA